MRRTISLDGRWKILPPKVSHEPIIYEKELEFDFQGVDVDTGTWDDITVPSNWHMVYLDTCPIPPERNYWYGQVGHDQYVSSWYRTMFTLPEQVCGERVVIRFNQVGHEAHVWVNGREVGSHKGSFTAFDFDITDYVVDGDNVLAVWVCNDFGTNPPKRTYGKMFSSWSNVGGIVGHVSVKILPDTHIRKVLCSPSIYKQQIDIGLDIFRASDGDGLYQIYAHYKQMLHGNPCTEDTKLDLGAVSLDGGNNSLALVLPVRSPALWSPDMPNIYEITLELCRNGAQVDSIMVKTGFREFVASNGRFFLNGERIRLYCGNITTGARRDGLRDFIKMQKEYNVNTIRYHMAGGSQLICDLEVCDEEGILVINEFPWFHRVFEVLPEGEALEVFTANLVQDMTDWVEQNHNNPSVIMWCLSNEAWNNSVVKPLDVLYGVVKQTDRQKRLVSAGSGMHCYGMPDIPLRTDVFDDHNYTVNMEIPWSLLPEVFEARYKIFENIYGEVDKPWATLEFTSFGFKEPKIGIEADKNITADEYVRLANLVDIQTVGLRTQVQNKDWYNRLVEKLSKETLEQLRLETRIQGVHPWYKNREHLPDILKAVYNPIFVGLGTIVKSYFDGKPFEIDVAVVDDRLKGITGTVDVQLSSCNEVIAQTECQVELAPGQEITTVRCIVPVSRIGHTGLCSLTLTLKNESGELINRNFYDIFCVSEESNTSESVNSCKAAIIVPESNQEGWMRVFAHLGIDVTLMRTLDHLGEFEYLFICSLQDKDTDIIGLLRDNSKRLHDWISRGGYVVCLEWTANIEIPWLQEYTVVSNSSTKSTFVDPVVPEHPLFHNIPLEALDSWLGHRNLVVESMITPLTANALAASASFTEHGVLSTIVEGRLGAGQVLISTMMAHRRYGLDAVATMFLRNLSTYVQRVDDNTVVREFPPRPKNLHVHRLSRLTDRDVVAFRGQSQTGFSEFLTEACNVTASIDDIGASWHDFLGTQLEGTSFNMRDLVYDSLPNIPVLRGANAALSMKSISGVKVSRLILVHTGTGLSEPVAARYGVKYADGTEESIPVRVGAEIGELFSPSGTHAVDEADRMQVDISEGLSINVYLTVWENPYPEKIVNRIVLSSIGQSCVASLGVTGVRSVEWGADVRGKEWNFNTPSDVGSVQDIDRLRFDSDGFSAVMGSHNPQFSLDMGGKVINARQYNVMHMRFYCSEPHRVGIVFKTVEGMQGQAYIPVNKGWGEYQVDLMQKEFRVIGGLRAGTARIGWGGETYRIAELSIVPGNRTGVEFAVGWVRLFGEGASKTVWYE